MAFVMLLEIACVLTLLVGSDAAEQDGQCFSSSVPVTELPGTPEVGLAVFTELAFACDGEVAAWALYTQASGTVFASVWRPDGDRLIFIGRNRLDVSAEGAHDVVVPKGSRLRVQAGDVIGFHYASVASQPIVPHIDSTADAAAMAALELSSNDMSPYMTSNMDDTDIAFSMALNMEIESTQRLPALKPIMNTGGSRIAANFVNEGRATYLGSGEWGTICADTIPQSPEQSWGQIFCKELGYDHVSLMIHANDTSTGSGHGAIGLHNPVCPIGALSMEECSNNDGTCDHGTDVYIRCEHSVKLDTTSPFDTNEGVTMAYDANTWGHVCSDDLSLDGWPRVFCQTLGFEHATNAYYQGDLEGEMISNPECSGADGFSQCTSGGACVNQQAVFVQCQHNVRLVGTPYSDRGRVEYLGEDGWGTVCDDVYTRSTWPSVVCQQLGFDDVTDAFSASASLAGAGSGSISFRGPLCNPNIAAGLGECLSDQQNCTHDQDVYIQCQETDYCSSHPCRNGAECISLLYDYTCQCRTGFTAYDCEIDIDYCADEPCQNGASCVDLLETFECSCATFFTGDVCDEVYTPEEEVVVKSYAVPDQGIGAVIVEDEPFSDAVIGLSMSIFQVESCSGSGLRGAVKFVSDDHPGYCIRHYDNTVVLENCESPRDPGNMPRDACYFPTISTQHPGYYSFESANEQGSYITVVNGSLALLESTDDEPSRLFYFENMGDTNTIELFEEDNFDGEKIALTHDEPDLINRGFDDRVHSFKITGAFSWQLFSDADYQGSSTIAAAGQYNSDWLQARIGVATLSSVRAVMGYDAITLWDQDNFDGTPYVMEDTASHVMFSVTEFPSVEVTGPSSWELFDSEYFRGSRVVVAPGQYDQAWLLANLGSLAIKSARRMDMNLAFCSVTGGYQSATGSSGRQHSTYIEHREDGTVWMRLGRENVEEWTSFGEDEEPTRLTVFSAEDLDALRDFEFTEYHVETDLEFSMGAASSWHPSNIEVFYLKTKLKDSLRLQDTFITSTVLTLNGAGDRLQCLSAGGAEVCGENGLPEVEEISDQLLIADVDLDPRGFGAYAKDDDWESNQYTLSGTKYYVWAKLADCILAEVCYQRSEDISYLSGLTLSDSSDTTQSPFYLGTFVEEASCEDACREQLACSGFTFYTTSFWDVESRGKCYGFAADAGLHYTEVKDAISGIVATCAGVIPSYMEMDIWTLNTTGCACVNDVTSIGCACCHEKACQCSAPNQYQCVMAGHKDMCGWPSVSMDMVYNFEAGELAVTDEGEHFEVPELCVTECRLVVDAATSSATEVAAHLTDWNDLPRLSCVVDTSSSDDAYLTTNSLSGSLSGVPVTSVHMYGFNGYGYTRSLQLTLNPDGCQDEERDERYVGCFAHDRLEAGATINAHALESSHMTRETCISHCFGLDFAYAGMQDGTGCYCGSVLPSQGSSFTCDLGCSGNAAEMCGGSQAITVYTTNFDIDVYYFTTDSTCEKVGAQFETEVGLRMSADSCNKLTGNGPTGPDDVTCIMDLCSSSHIVSGGLYPSAPGSCGTRQVATINLYVLGADCVSLGGAPVYDQSSWGYCAIDLCQATSSNEEVLVAMRVGGCSVNNMVAEGVIMASLEGCGALGGSTIGESGSDLIECHLDICRMNEDALADNIYEFPHYDLLVPSGVELQYDVDGMCIVECDMYISAPENDTLVRATFLGSDDNELGLECMTTAVSGGTSDVLGFAHPATGVKVEKVVLTASGDAGSLTWLKLRLDTVGCQEDEAALVLYSGVEFSGPPAVVRQDSGDLGEYNNMASSVRVLGQSMWQVFEHPGFTGKSIVLTPGEYSDPHILPFGDDQLSSARLVADEDIPRQEISDTHGVVCFQRETLQNYVFGLIEQPRSENRPITFYFGDFENDVDKCEQACRAEANCAAWTLHLSSYADAEWAGQCYGRGFHEDVDVVEENVVGGMVAHCRYEDTITFFKDINFVNMDSTIVENNVNFTISAEYGSMVISGNDQWRVICETMDSLHTYYFPAGEYTDLSLLVAAGGRVLEVDKVHPNTQYYEGATSGLEPIAPVAMMQIQEVIPGSETVTTTEECTETQIADVSFVLDASSSIREENFVKVMDFVVNITRSFYIGQDTVRVAVIMFTRYVYVDIELADFENATALEEKILSIPYYRGSTYTYKALNTLRENVLNATVCRENVTRLAIVMTDGRSADTDLTAEAAHLCRDDGISMLAIGVGSADDDELLEIGGDSSRVFHVSTFDELEEMTQSITQASCQAVNQMEITRSNTVYHAVVVPGDDEAYFLEQHWDFTRMPNPLGLENGVILDSAMFSSSAKRGFEGKHARLNHASGWLTSDANQWIEVDLERIIPVHGIGVQGHGSLEAWVTSYKIAISLDGIIFNVLKDTNTSLDLVFSGPADQHTTNHHCLHRIFGEPIMARVVRIIVMTFHMHVALRFELYGYRDYDDPRLLLALKRDVWTRELTGCPCYFNPHDKSCACCEEGGCQCSSANKHQCVQCGMPHTCGTPSIRDMSKNVDGWTMSLSGCRCEFDPLRTDCACCHNFACQCGEANKNQCVNCGHPQHCGLKEWLFGINPYCTPKVCPESALWVEDALAEGY